MFFEDQQPISNKTSVQARFKQDGHNDKYEQEADRVANAMMRVPGRVGQRQTMEALQMKRQPEIQQNLTNAKRKKFCNKNRAIPLQTHKVCYIPVNMIKKLKLQIFRGTIMKTTENSALAESKYVAKSYLNQLKGDAFFTFSNNKSLFIRSKSIQPKLKKGQPNRVDDAVMRMPDSQMQPVEDDEELQMSQYGTPDIQRAMPEGDPIHDPLLDQYSRETGRPREMVTQHDPGYEQWLVPINITLNLSIPARNPAPDYSQSEDELNAWEQANFRYTPQITFNCESMTSSGVESSYVTDVGVQLINVRFEYFIARHIQQNFIYAASRRERGIWRNIRNRVQDHAIEHFNQYRQTVNTLQRDFYNRLATLPNRFNPMQVSKGRLETYVEALLRYFAAKLHYELWQVKCSWERADYPNILRGIRDVHGTLTPNCGSPPPTPVPPAMITTSPGPSGASSASQQNPSP